MKETSTKPQAGQSVIQSDCYASVDEWLADGRRRFGDDMMSWKFICPVCGHVASVGDWKAVGATDGEVAFSCVGRHIKDLKYMPGKPGPCDYAGGGLFRLNPVQITTAPGKTTRMFAFA